MSIIYKEIWDSSTTLGKCTVAIPLILLVYAVMMVLFVLIPFLYLMVKVAPSIDSVGQKVKSVFWKVAP